MADGEQSPWPSNVVPLRSRSTRFGPEIAGQAAEFLRDCKKHPFVAIILDDGGVLRVYEKDVTPAQRRTIQALLATMED